jgi:hypothetical protein
MGIRHSLSTGMLIKDLGEVSSVARKIEPAA